MVDLVVTYTKGKEEYRFPDLYRLDIKIDGKPTDPANYSYGLTASEAIARARKNLEDIFGHKSFEITATIVKGRFLAWDYQIEPYILSWKVLKGHTALEEFVNDQT